MLEQLDSYEQKNEKEKEPRPTSHTLYENQLKMDHKFKCKKI